MIFSNLYKLLECCLLPMMKRYVSLNPYQYGYRPNTSTLQATAIFKDVLRKYNDLYNIINHCTSIKKMNRLFPNYGYADHPPSELAISTQKMQNVLKKIMGV